MKIFYRNGIAFLLFLMSFGSNAANFTIDTRNAAYATLPNAQGVGVISYLAERQAAMFSLIGHHNTVVSPANPIEVGDAVTFKWQDGSSEKAMVNSMFSPSGVNPIPGTQSKPSGGGIGYTTDPNGNYYGGGNIIGFRPIYGTVTVCVGGVCESVSVITGYEWIYSGGPGNEAV